MMKPNLVGTSLSETLENSIAQARAEAVNNDRELQKARKRLNGLLTGPVVWRVDKVIASASAEVLGCEQSFEKSVAKVKLLTEASARTPCFGGEEPENLEALLGWKNPWVLADRIYEIPMVDVPADVQSILVQQAHARQQIDLERLQEEFDNIRARNSPPELGLHRQAIPETVRISVWRQD